MRRRIFIAFSAIAILVFWIIIAPITGCSTISRDYTATQLDDGGVSLKIWGTKRYWMPLTPEGPFPKQSIHFDVTVVGPGSDWEYRGQDGFYYNLQDIQCTKKHWDLGYAWMDRAREHIHFNLYWVSAPDELTPSDINGQYSTSKISEQRH
jgi:hypothetical protein